MYTEKKLRKKCNYRRKKTTFVVTLLFSFVIKTFAVQQTLPNFIVENPNVRQLRNSKPDLRQTHRGGACSGHKGIHLEEVRSLHTSLLIFKVLDLTKVPSAYALTAYHHFSLDDLMQFTCIQQPQKLYYSRLHTVIGICFWFGLERIIIVFQRKMCKSSLTLHQRVLPPGPKDITVFMIATTQGKKTPLWCKIHYRWFHL